MCGQVEHHHGHHGEWGCHEGRHGAHHEECECGCHEGRHAGECGCHEGDLEIHFERRFVTKAERLEELETYLKDLQAEAKGVQEKLAELKAVSA